ncbi:unnamed protein product [Mytilus coruscus]|uniref:Uncharacterized protein n=1 Tax=Mytilus coruscus TaxID=42192 RepID=A0A6J7ZWC2_MYTCO|nr:unnamed protein product [Mytilus coruscus]
MLNLTSDIQPAFASGQFAIRQKPGKFNGVWSDMATEKTVIKDSKGRGSIVGITRQKSALIRWSLTRHVLGELSAEMRSSSGFSAPEELFHEETRQKALQRDKEHVKLVVEHVHQRMTNPFDIKSHPKALINISTGMHAPKEIESSLTKAFDDGIKMVKSFVNGAFAEGNNRDLYGPIPRSKIKTFKVLTKKSKIKCRSGEVLSVHISP